MKLNQATDYAFRMVLYMSLLPFETKITGSELAKTLNIPERFLLKIMRNLTKEHIMKSYRGVDGGFALYRHPREISLLDIVEAVEGPAYMQRCLYDPYSCTRGCEGVCSVRDAFGSIQESVLTQMKEVNFETLAKKEKKLRQASASCQSCS